jgi:hypothetical protein
MKRFCHFVLLKNFFYVIIKEKGEIMRKLVCLLALICLPAMAEDVNMTPQNTYSGYYNQSLMRTTYPRLSTPTDAKAEIMKKKSVLEMGDTTPANDGTTPMTYSQFPQNYDSSNMMIQQGIQQGMQNMYMGL